MAVRSRVSEENEEGALGDSSRSTAEFDTSRPPLGVGDIGHHLIEAVLESNDTNGVGVGLSKDGTKTRDLLSGLEVHLLGEDLDGLLDPLVRDALNLGEVVGRDGRLVREVEAEFGGGDERSLLVNVVAEDLTESVVEDVGSGVVVAEGPAAELGKRASQPRLSQAEATETHLVVGRNDLVANREGSLLDGTNVKNVAIEDLDVLDVEVGLAVNDDATSVALLSSRLGVEVGLVEQDSDESLIGGLRGRLVELARVVDGLDLGVDVAEAWVQIE